jgi:hypothetical protein
MRLSSGGDVVFSSYCSGGGGGGGGGVGVMATVGGGGGVTVQMAQLSGGGGGCGHPSDLILGDPVQLPLPRSTVLGFQWVDPLGRSGSPLSICMPTLVGIQTPVPLRWVHHRLLPR